MSTDYSKANSQMSGVARSGAKILEIFVENIKKNVFELSQSLLTLIFISIYMFYSSRLILSFFVLCLFVYILMVQFKVKWVIGEKEDEIKKDSKWNVKMELSSFILIFFLWFLLSSLWTGPTHYGKCTWREYSFGWWIYVIMGVQTLFVFAPEPNEKHDVKRYWIILSYVWILNFIYPSRYIVTGCTEIWVFYVKVIFMIISWNCFEYSPYMRIRMMGILCVMGFWMVFVAFAFIVGRFLFTNFEISYDILPPPNVEHHSKKKNKS